MLEKYYFCQTRKSDGNMDNLIINTETKTAARVLFFSSYREMVQEVNTTKSLAYSVVVGYNIALFYVGNLATGTRIEISPAKVDELKADLNGMARWLYNFRVETKPGKYRKFETYRNP